MFAPKGFLKQASIPWGYATHYRPESRAPEPEFKVTFDGDDIQELPVLYENPPEEIAMPTGFSFVFQIVSATQIKIWLTYYSTNTTYPENTRWISQVTTGVPVRGYVNLPDAHSVEIENASSVTPASFSQVQYLSERVIYITTHANPTIAYG